MKNLENAVKMAGSVKNLCKYINRHKSFEPFEIIGMASEVGFDKTAFKELIAGEQKKIDEKPKVTEHTMVLFSHPDIGKEYLQSVDSRIKVDTGWTIHTMVTLKAKKPEQLEVGLDNPRILQKIKDAGNFQGMIASIRNEYQNLIAAHYTEELDERDASVDTIAQKLSVFVNKAQDEAVDRAQKCAEVEFGKKAGVQAEVRKRNINCAFAVVKVGMGIFATAAGFATTIAAGFVGLHGTLKSIDSTVRLFRSSYQGFEKNMCSAESCYKQIAAAASMVGSGTVQASSRIAETFFGDAVNYVKQGEGFLDMATGDLNKIDSAADDIVSSLNSYLSGSAKMAQNISGLESELQSLKSNPAADAKLIAGLEEKLASAKSMLSNMEGQVDAIIKNCVHQSTFVNGCLKRIAGVRTLKESLDPGKGMKVFLKVWEVLELTTGILGGGFAAGGGFSGEALIGGLNPMNDAQWITIGNFTGIVDAVDDMVGVVYDVKDKIAEKASGS